MPYVYIYFDPRKSGNYKYEDLEFNHEPFYVGLGKGNRYLAHLNLARYGTGWDKGRNPRKITKIKSILSEKLEPIIIKFKDNITYEECKLLEKELIKKIGRHDLNLGPLHNLTDGGDTSAGYRFTEEQRKKIKYNHADFSGANHPMYGKQHSTKTKDAISKALTGKKQKPEDKAARGFNSARNRIEKVFKTMIVKGLDINESNYNDVKIKYFNRTFPKFSNRFKYFSLEEYKALLSRLQSNEL